MKFAKQVTLPWGIALDYLWSRGSSQSEGREGQSCRGRGDSVGGQVGARRGGSTGLGHLDGQRTGSRAREGGGLPSRSPRSWQKGTPPGHTSIVVQGDCSGLQDCKGTTLYSFESPQVGSCVPAGAGDGHGAPTGDRAEGAPCREPELLGLILRSLG